MKKNGKKRQSPLASFLKKREIVPIQYEDELTLHFAKDELFDRHVILPHAEVNQEVYEKVDRFTERYGGDRLTLTIYSDAISEISQEFFREAFVSHYEDEYRHATLYLYRWYIRVILLALVSVGAYYTARFLSARVDGIDFLAIAITNIGIYCLWEVFNTEMKRRETSKLRKRICRARDAEIQFRTQ